MQGNERGEINEMEEQPMTVVVDQARRKPAICNLHLLVICTTTVHTTLYLHRLCSEVRERGEHRVSKRDKSVVPLLRRSICCWWAGRVAYYILLCNVTPVTGQKVYCSSSRLFLVDSLADGRYYSMYGVRQGGHQEGQPIETSLRNKQ